jgi:hypothetical protein
MKPIPLKYKLLPVISATVISMLYFRKKKDGLTSVLIFAAVYFVSYFIISAVWREAQIEQSNKR